MPVIVIAGFFAMLIIGGLTNAWLEQIDNQPHPGAAFFMSALSVVGAISMACISASPVATGAAMFAVIHISGVAIMDNAVRRRMKCV